MNNKIDVNDYIDSKSGSSIVNSGIMKALEDIDFDIAQVDIDSPNPEDIENENFKEKFNVFQLLCCPRQSLFITYLASGEKSTPCLAVEEIEKMFELDENYVKELKKTQHVFGEKQAKEKLVCEASKIADGNACALQEASSLYHALGDNTVLSYLPINFEKPNLQKGKNLLLPKEKTSVTKIECFYSCPYKYFLQNGLLFQNPHGILYWH